MDADTTAGRLAVLKEKHREEVLDSFDTFSKGGEAENVLSCPAWRRQAVLEREARLRAAC